MLRKVAVSAMLVVLGIAGFSHAQSYPSKSVRVIVGFAPGGST